VGGGSLVADRSTHVSCSVAATAAALVAARPVLRVDPRSRVNLVLENTPVDNITWGAISYSGAALFVRYIEQPVPQNARKKLS